MLPLDGLMRPASWRVETVALGRDQRCDLPIIDLADVVPLIEGVDLWDMWQLRHVGGATAILEGRSYWFFLAAPRFDDPEQRHDHARIRLLSRGSDGWRDHGNALPDEFSPGSREWSGSAVLHPDLSTVSLYFTAAGRREGGPHFEQRLFDTRGHLIRSVDSASIHNWSPPRELFTADGILYAPAREQVPTNGMILGFRDPGYFRDPSDGREYIVFTGSAALASDAYDGVIGIARCDGDAWTLLPPLVEAIGVAKELERPHIITHDERYYLFWSTQESRFAPGVSGRTGLYGMVADRMTGPWQPLNHSTLVVANPPAEPSQAYCWWVTDELDVFSFVDRWGLGNQRSTVNAEASHRRFGGTIAPTFRLQLDGDRCAIVDPFMSNRVRSA